MGRIEELSFSELVHELSHFEHDAGPPDLEKSIRRRSLDARLMRLLAADTPVDERRASVRVPGDMAVKLIAGEAPLSGTLVDIGEGGIRVHLKEGSFDAAAVEVELDFPDHHGRATASVQWKKPRESGLDVGLHFQTQTDVQRRRMRRLVLEILRQMPQPS
ncbi:MAG: PilZ domain [Myxococcales bacterium]|nr:PilZ domain [Myxococcales bacterium]